MPLHAPEPPSLAPRRPQALRRPVRRPRPPAHLPLLIADALGLHRSLCAEALYGPRPEADAGYVDEVLCRTWQLPEAEIARLWWARGQVEPFLEECLTAIPWDEHTLVGFTSIFQQNVASLALAARVK